jgi:hypothetical protein
MPHGSALAGGSPSIVTTLHGIDGVVGSLLEESKRIRRRAVIADLSKAVAAFLGR